MRRMAVAAALGLTLGCVLYYCFLPSSVRHPSKLTPGQLARMTRDTLSDLRKSLVLFQEDHGRRPASLEELVERRSPYLYPPGVPRDLFQSTNPVRSVRDEAGEIEFVYSFGPDEDDDRCTIAYDPTNGTVSDGDIFMKWNGKEWVLPGWNRGKWPPNLP